jgi:hypothetical protein
VALGLAQRNGYFGTTAIVMGLIDAACVVIIFVTVRKTDKRLGRVALCFQLSQASILMTSLRSFH